MNRHELLDTIRRLLALATSANEHEAAAAVARAAELMDRYSLDARDLSGGHDTPGCCGEHGEERLWVGARVAPEHVIAAAIVVRFFGVAMIRSSDASKSQCQLLVFGTPARRAVAAYVWTYLVREFRWLARRERIVRGRRKAFFEGLAIAVQTLLESRLPGRGAGLVPVKTALGRALEEAYGTLPAMRSRASRDSAAIACGMSAGSQIEIPVALEGTASQEARAAGVFPFALTHGATGGADAGEAGG